MFSMIKGQRERSFGSQRRSIREARLKITRLRELEVKVTRLEEIIDSQKERDIGSSVGERSLGKSISSFSRTCRELHASDPSLTSEM